MNELIVREEYSATIVERDVLSMFLGQLTPNTRKAYEKDILQFCVLIGCPKENLHGLPAGDLFEYGTRFARDDRYSTASRARRLSSVRSYLQFLCSIGILYRNPLENVSTAKVKNKRKDILSDEDVEKIFKSINTSTRAGARDFLALLLLVEQGLRRNEILSIKYGDITKNVEGRTVAKVTRKGDRDDERPLSRRSIEAIERCKELDGLTVVSPGTHIIRNKFGNRMSGQRLFEIIKEYARKSGIEKEISPHSFRHYAITDAAKVEDSVPKLMQFSGHQSASTLGRYIHFKNTEAITSIQEKRGIH